MKQDSAKLEMYVKTVEIHIAHIERVRKKLTSLLPFTAEVVRKLGFDQQEDCDVLIYRFTHLQDTMVGKVLPLYLEITQEHTLKLSFIDKLHLLERLEIIEDAYAWQDIRQLRNHFAHDYDLQPEKQAHYLNELFKVLPILMQGFERIKMRLSL